jgi:hypothetical protein
MGRSKVEAAYRRGDLFEAVPVDGRLGNARNPGEGGGVQSSQIVPRLEIAPSIGYCSKGGWSRAIQR